MTTLRDILNRVFPDADAPLLTICGTNKAFTETLHKALTGFSTGDSRFLLCCLPTSFLSGNTPRARALRDKLLSVDTNWLDASVLLPDGIIDGIDGEAGLIVLDKNRLENNKTEILFIDARGEEWVEACEDYRDVLLKKKPILASHYCQDSVSTALEKIRNGGKPLLAVADILIAPQSAPEGEEYNCLSVKNISEFGYTILDSCEKKHFSEINNDLFLQRNDLLVVLQGAIGRTAIVWPNIRCIPAYMTAIVRSKQINPKILYMYLRSELAQAYFRRCTTGAAQPRIPVPALKTLPVPIFSDKTADEMLFGFKEVNDLRSQIKAATMRAENVFKKFFPAK